MELLPNLICVVGWPILSVISLFSLRQRKLAETMRVLWALLIVVVPFLGAIAFWIVRPGDSNHSQAA